MGESETNCERRTVPQKTERQWGQFPIMRKAAWLHGCSLWNWQRFLAGMTLVKGSSG
jgi:hypothetical protein